VAHAAVALRSKIALLKRLFKKYYLIYYKNIF